MARRPTEVAKDLFRWAYVAADEATNGYFM